MYTCGPSIYQLPHIGNYRTFLFEDVLIRYLEYIGYTVERALFITDVEDKSIGEAKKRQISLKDLVANNLRLFLGEYARLRALTPRYLVRSSEVAPHAAQLIEKLVRSGYAYWYGGDAYFDPTRFNSFGRLAGIDTRDWPKRKRRFHRDTYPGNVWNRGDFILWHGAKKGDPYHWCTRIGEGRPSWNVQDPAMALKTAGLKADIYCGGVDNLVRHHDYIRAIAEAYTGKKFSNFWLHGEHLVVDGKKMSKSRGNIVYPKDLITRACPWKHLRYFLIYGNYRERLNFTSDKFCVACDRLRETQKMVAKLQKLQAVSKHAKSSAETLALIARISSDFEASMNDNLQVRAAVDGIHANLHELLGAKDISAVAAGQALQRLEKIDTVLQVLF
jgi:cysteinyl-tRNA synthetase